MSFDFSQIEVDEAPAKAKDPRDLTVDELAAELVEFDTDAQSVPVAPAVDPIDAFRDRMAQNGTVYERKAVQRAEARAQVTEEPVVVEEKIRTESDLIAVETNDQTTGAVIYWALSGDLDLAAVRAAWGSLPVEWIPEPPTSAAALTRAAKDEQNRSLLVRKNSLGGWSFVAEHDNNGTLSYEAGPRVFVDALDGLVKTDESGSIWSPELHDDLLFRVRAAYAQHLQTVAAPDVSAWLIRTVGKLNAVSLRDRGGVYFVPREKVATFRALRDAIKAGSVHSISTIPALKSAEAVAAILEAVTRETNELAEDTRGVLVADLGSRAAKTRIEAIDALLSKVAGYEKLLGCKIAVGDIRDLRTKVAAYCPGGALLEVD